MAAPSMSVDEGTITTDDNETFQESMIEDLFNAEQFSEVDTCVEILSRPPPTPRKTASVGSRSRKSHRSNHSSKSGGASRKTKSLRRASSGSQHSKRTSGGASRGTVQVQIMQPIDEDVDKLVREDVRKMIAKIRNSTQQTKTKSEAGEDDAKSGSASTKVAEKLVRPGKYGEVDLRSASAQARKELFRKIKREKVKKRQTSIPPGKKRAQASANNSRSGKEEEVREQPEGTQNGQSHKSIQLSTKEGYYKNKPADPKEQTSAADISKEKASGQTNTNSTKEGLNSSVEKDVDKNVLLTVAGAVAKAAVSKEATKSGTPESSEKDSVHDATSDPSKDKNDNKKENGEKDGTSAMSSDKDASDTEKIHEHVHSMPKIEKLNEADESEPIEVVLATLTELEEERRKLMREFGKKPDPSVEEEEEDTKGRRDAEEQVSSASNNADASHHDEDPPGTRSPPPDARPDPSEVKTQVRVMHMVHTVVSPAHSAEREPEEEAPMISTKTTPQSPTDPSRELVGEPGQDTNARPSEPATETENRAEASPETTVQNINEATEEETYSPTGGDTTTGDSSDDGTVEMVLVTDSDRVKQLEYENAKLKDTLLFLQHTAVEKEKYFAELAWFGKRSEEEVKKWRPNFWRERLSDLGPELFEEFRADAMRIADPDVGDWEHGFSSGSLAMARLLLGLSHAVEDENICAFHDPDQPCTKHCVTCTVAEQRARELADFPVLDP